jgi:tetratricopeptide (TPR) repeat protein
MSVMLASTPQLPNDDLAFQRGRREAVGDCRVANLSRDPEPVQKPTAGPEDISGEFKSTIGSDSDACTEILKEAIVICQSTQSAESDEPKRLYLRGLCARHQGRRHVAIACFARAAEMAPSNPTYQTVLGDELVRQQRFQDAEVGYRSAMRILPRSAEPYLRLSRLFLQQKRHADAEEAAKRALQLDSMSGRAIAAMADVCHASGRLHEASRHYEASISRDPGAADTYLSLGRTRLSLKQPDLALEAFSHGLQLAPNHLELLVAAGETRLQLGLLRDAVETLRTALSVDPRHVVACRLLICSLEMMERREEATNAWFSLGQALESQGRLEEAVVVYQQTLARKADHLRARFALGAVLLQLGKPEEAIKLLDSALALEPHHAGARLDRGWALGLLGDLQPAWDEFRWHESHGERPRRYFEQPRWDGRPLEGRTILLWADQGLGDTIQFLRYMSLIVVHGGRVVVECDRRLVPVVSRLPNVDRAIARRMPLPAFDTHAPLTDLPRIFGTRSDSIPREVPYLTIDATLQRAWRQRLGPSGNRNIGLVWGGEPTKVDAGLKFASLAAFKPLTGLPNVRFISIQQGPPVAELLSPPAGLHINVQESSSIAETGALILNLDLVLTVDTMVAHLAGALGKPVWTLLRHAPDWRWLHSGDVSPWYPTMRLVRQARDRAWSGPLEQVRACLEHAWSPNER